MKVEDKKKVVSKIVWKLFLAILIAFSAIYISAETGYYEFEQHKKTALTDEKIKQFDKDVATGKKIDINDYVVSQGPNYKTRISEIGYGISNGLENIVQNGIETTFDFLNKMVSG